jgi:hypothetical protein
MGLTLGADGTASWNEGEYAFSSYSQESVPYPTCLEVSLHQARLGLSRICTIEGTRPCMNCWIVTHLDREQPQKSVVVVGEIEIKGLKNVQKVLFADSYGNLTVTLKTKQYRTL